MNVHDRPLRIAVLCPHFAPDTAPTGEVITRIVHELAALGHELHVVTALPWYREHRLEAGWTGKLVRREPRPGVPSPECTRSRVTTRPTCCAALRVSLGFSALAGLTSLRGGRVDAVIAMSPPLTMGLTGWATHLVRRGPLVFNIQDVFPDAAVETGAITNRRIIAVARWLERVSYHRAAAVTVLSDDLRDNVAAKVKPARRTACTSSPTSSTPSSSSRRPDHPLRDELGIGDEPGGALCRQRRVLTVAGDGGRRSPRVPGGDVPHQRRRRGAGVTGGTRCGLRPMSCSAATSPRNVCPRCWPPATSIWCR
jgi:colanic acid biosynthesis glycosyl transferase WcaI